MSENYGDPETGLGASIISFPLRRHKINPRAPGGTGDFGAFLRLRNIAPRSDPVRWIGSDWLWVKKPVPQMEPGKWKLALQPAAQFLVV